MKKISTSKKLIGFLFVNCVVIQLVVLGLMVLMVVQSPTTGLLDFTPLTALISAVVAEVVGYSIYSLKAMRENVQGGIAFETALQEMSKKQEEDNE